MCFADLSTAQVFATVIDGARMDEELLGELGTYAPREVILNVGARRCAKAADWLKSQGVMLSDNQAGRFDPADCAARVKERFGETVKPEVLENRPLVCAVGALLDYLTETQKTDLATIRELTVYSEGQYLGLDPAAIWS